eukprot:2907732-Prymnesium_polylepis.2
MSGKPSSMAASMDSPMRNRAMIVPVGSIVAGALSRSCVITPDENASRVSLSDIASGFTTISAETPACRQ